MKNRVCLLQKKFEEVSLAHLVREVDVQPSHPGSSLQRREFGFLFKKNAVGASPTAFPLKKRNLLGSNHLLQQTKQKKTERKSKDAPRKMHRI
jgi:hypothetical protein